MSPRALGALVAILTLLADQASKAWILYGLRLPERPPLRVGSLFELVMVWNRGVSYGMFQQHADWGRYGLFALSLAAAVGLSVWLSRQHSRLVAVALGLLIGGAIGNAVDRLLYGAVADFVLLHWIPFFPYVFNVADSAISIGVVLLILDAVLAEGRKRRSGASTPDPKAGR